MKRVIVIGCPGSGKSTFSAALRKKTGLPLYHLDMLYWNADKTTVEREVFLSRVAAVTGKDEWILDGNFHSTMESRMARCDTVFFLDYSSDVCLDGVRSRRGRPRPDMPWIETEEDAEFTAYIRDFGRERRPFILALLEKYSEKCIYVFRTRGEADAFLENL